MKKTLSNSRATEQSASPWVAILGNPNCGKTALFNRLTGLHHKVGNYPGITVEKKYGTIRGTELELHDMPGTYSLDAKSLDEQVVTDTLHSWRDQSLRPVAALVVMDATNVSRSLFLATQVLEHRVPTILVLNMMDEARKRQIKIDVNLLRDKLSARAVIEASAKTGEGIDEIITALKNIDTSQEIPGQCYLKLEDTVRDILSPINTFILAHDTFHKNAAAESLELLSTADHRTTDKSRFSLQESVELTGLLETARSTMRQNGIDPETLEAMARYAFIDSLVRDVLIAQDDVESKSEKLDGILTHPAWGGMTLVLLLAFIFNAIFTWAQTPMAWIEIGVEWLGTTLGALIPPGALNSLVTDGIVAGVGNVIIFLPQIILLIFFLGLLEDSGYMSRMAFMMDKGFNTFGLQGKAVLPLLSGFACAIPAIMAARTIENRRDRLITIMLIPLMSCSARLPVYTLLIAAFVPQRTLLGFLQLQGLVLLGAYFLGFFTALIASFIMKKVAGRKQRSHFVMELPPYRLPMLRSVFHKVYDGAKLFLVNAGSIILAISIVLWFLASYPKVDDASSLTARERIEQSYAGKIGHAIEPIIKPLGFDWKIGVGLLTSFAAREVIVSAFATLYNLEDDGGNNVSLVTALQHDQKADGSPTYPPIVGISLIVFFVFAAQCMSTIAIVKRETNSWRWPLVMLLYMNAIAYISSFLVYQIGTLFWG